MIDLSGNYRKMWTGEGFTGKFTISTKSLEQLFHIKNGKLCAPLLERKIALKICRIGF